jgi:predicted phage terminase large subunit-like protein
MAASASLSDAPPIELRPQVGPQEDFLASPADIAIAGGAAGVGKTWGLLIEPLRHIDNPHFDAVIFRRTYTDIKKPGGLWDEASEIYPLLDAVPNQQDLKYAFPRGMSVTFAHMQHVKDRLDWKGAQIPLISFDQLEDFEEDQFWYLFSRNRSAKAGIRPYIRATCNPVPDDDQIGGWLHKLITWWIDPESGYPIWERSGVLRWFVRIGDQIEWADSPDALRARFEDLADEDVQPKSLTFIPGLLKHNQALERADPGYRANLMALPFVERERLLGGNWKVKATAGKVFNRAWFKTLLSTVPMDVDRWVIFWDKAGTEGAGKYSAGVLMGRRANGRYVIANVVRGQWSALNREIVIQQTAEFYRANGLMVDIWLEQEPGSGGKESAESSVRNLAGFTVHAEQVTGDKVTRAGPFSAQAEAGNVDLVLAPWNEAFLTEAQNFDGVHGFSDQIDAASGAFNKLTLAPKPMQVVRLRGF